MFKKRAITEDDLRALSAQVKRISQRATVVCDFCGHASPVAIYAAKRMSTGAPIECWRWAACQPCDEAITAKNWDKLTDRIMVAMWALRLLGFGIPQIKVAVDISLQEFLEAAIVETEKGEHGG